MTKPIICTCENMLLTIICLQGVENSLGKITSWPHDQLTSCRVFGCRCLFVILRTSDWPCAFLRCRCLILHITTFCKWILLICGSIYRCYFEA